MISRGQKYDLVNLKLYTVPGLIHIWIYFEKYGKGGQDLQAPNVPEANGGVSTHCIPTLKIK